MLSTSYSLVSDRVAVSDASLLDATLFLRDVMACNEAGEAEAAAATIQRHSLLDPTYGIGPHSDIEDRFNTIIDLLTDGVVPAPQITALWKQLNEARLCMRDTLNRKRAHAQTGTFEARATNALSAPLPIMTWVWPPE